MSVLLSLRRPAFSARSRFRFTARLMSSYFDNCPYVLSPQQLRELQVEAPEDGLTILDASWNMPNNPRDALKEFRQEHIPGAHRLDLDEVASPHDLGLKHMLPTPEIFAEACGTSSKYTGVLAETYELTASRKTRYLTVFTRCSVSRLRPFTHLPIYISNRS